MGIPPWSARATAGCCARSPRTAWCPHLLNHRNHSAAAAVAPARVVWNKPHNPYMSCPLLVGPLSHSTLQGELSSALMSPPPL